MTTGPRRIGKYELQARLGRGGMTEVWKALDPYLQRYVAIKFLHADLRADPDFMKRFEREAVVIASLHHPNIVQVHDFQGAIYQDSKGEERGATDASSVAYMVMDYIEGEDLANYIRKTSRMNRFPSAASIVHLFAGIGAAVDYAHSKGMIHRDIKPANILLDARNTSHNPMGEPILTDFGIVKLLGASTGTLSGSWLGTPNYISPEQAHGRPGNERSDIYALGVILYEICTGVRPFQGDNPVAIIMQHITAMPTPPTLINPSIPPALSEVILRSLAKDPEARFPTASALSVALAQALNVPMPGIRNTPISQVQTDTRPPTPSNTSFTPSGPIYQTSSQPGPRISTTPSLPPPSVVDTAGMAALHGALQNIPGDQINPSFATSMTPPGLTTTHGTSATPFTVNTAQDAGSTGGMAPSQSPPILTPPQTLLPRKRSRTRLIASLALLIIILAGATFSALYFLTHKSSSTSPSTVQRVGQIAFKSSGPVDANSTRGIEDQVQIDLQNIPPPASGKGYFAWLLSDGGQTPTQYIALGFAPFDHGNLHWFYQDPQQNNLLGMASRVLITQENANSKPTSPSSDHPTGSYAAAIPSLPSDNGDGVLLALRKMLYEGDQELVALGIHGGTDIQLFRNTRKVSELATAAKDAWDNKDAQAISALVISILTYLDGTTHVQQDLPPNTPLPTGTPPSVQVPLLSITRSQGPNNYPDRIHGELVGIVVAPGASTELFQLASKIDDELGNVRVWFDSIRKDARQLLALPNKAQLLQPSALLMLQEMETLAGYAFSGNVARSQVGVMAIHDQIQSLPTFDITPNKQ